jgi:group I intron endonuclease
MLIYKACNNINGKIYVGQTRKSLAQRRDAHLSRARAINARSNTPFYNALRKYGFDNFSWCVVEEVADISMLNSRETSWINSLSSFYPDGYNLMREGKNGLDLSCYSTIKRSKADSSRSRCPEATKIKISNSLKNRYKQEGFDKIRALKISEAVKAKGARKPSKFLFIFNNNVLGLQEEVKYISDWRRKYSISYASAKRLVSGKINQIGGWTYAGKRPII